MALWTRMSSGVARSLEAQVAFGLEKLSQV